MMLNQKIYTTFYSKSNQTGTVVDEVKKSVYSEDGNLVEEYNVKVLLSDGKVYNVDVNNLVAYDEDHDLPEFFSLPISEQIKIQEEEAKLLDLANKEYSASIEFFGSSQTIKRTFKGSRLEINAYIKNMFDMLRPLGYNSHSHSLSSIK